MAIYRRMLVLANSAKKGSGRCIAGREILSVDENTYKFGSWLRPISTHGEGELWPNERICDNGNQIKVMDFVDVPLIDKSIDPCQPENWRISNTDRWKNVNSEYKLSSLNLLIESPENLWLQPKMQPDRVFHEYLKENPPDQSLYIIRPQNFLLRFWSDQWNGITKRKRRCRFDYKGVTYDLGLTDPVIGERYRDQIPGLGQPTLEARLPCSNNLLICLSLAGNLDNYHYKVVATIFEEQE
ncbi:dual OB domain-containing protein [Zavarzinella formosa]|uniref:dual OB domain-containing protein n=1 Tax=Zavarzinella formosa TaxID=360055 RepID=UPI0004967172|nr:hypothetical protein [Zavarzinella formosa]